MTINQYLKSINNRYKRGNYAEHNLRGDLLNLLETLLPDVQITNETKQLECGILDFGLTVKDIPIGYIETKGIGDTDLEGKRHNKEQFDRYKAYLPNLIFTDYLNFHFYRGGGFITKIAIGEETSKGIKPLSENFEAFENLIKDFGAYVGQTIKSSEKLAKMMARKARILSDVIHEALVSDEDKTENNTLKEHMTVFKKELIHDITEKGFADIYAQTITYGMFAARLHDTSLDTFSRQEAAEMIPKTNPFLRSLFGYIAGPDIDDRIKRIVDDLALIFRATNLEALLKDYGKSKKMEDPIIHFYEDFLSEYDPKLRKSRGVWYTPKPVVNFIVRAVDDILKNEFNLPQGLADTSKTNIEVEAQGKKEEYEVLKVQILDPATGTGTFLAEVVKQIHQKFKGQQGFWSNYVENYLLPRLNGFELLMASYAMAHLKMDLVMRETGFHTDTDQRFRIYLTNSLEEHHPDTTTLFATWLSAEANEANRIKREAPVMCVIGNPPYSGESANKGKWIMKLMEDYKKEPGGKVKLKERNSKWINDDYVKFIRFAQHFIEKNGIGVLAYINPHGFLDNPTFRGMRWNLLKTYDKIYTIDLHGNAKKKETAPEGSADENVFDIMQGVSINLFIKTGKKKPTELGKVFHYDLYGKREFKYNWLIENSLKTIEFKELPNKAPMYFMVEKDFEKEEEYNKGFSVVELFPVNSVGIVTARDNFTIHDSKEEVTKTIEEFLKIDDETARLRFNLGKDVRDWQVGFARKDLQASFPKTGKYVKISYRPFDDKWTFYTGKSKGFHCRPRGEVMRHFTKEENVGLAICKQFKTGDNYYHAFISNKIIESSYVSNRTSEITSIFPLYLYPDTDELPGLAGPLGREPNLNMEIVNKIAKNLNLTFLPDDNLAYDLPAELGECFSPLDLLDYIYAILHSPTYREKYKEFLKIDFPRIPYPKNNKTFEKLVELGSEIRQIHLLESPVFEKPLHTHFPDIGDKTVDNPTYKNGNVYINETQCFENVPEVAWNFYIGGYQPAQKWLKDRKNREISYEDGVHYQKIIVALTETDRLMQEIDKIDFE
jgi:predicted helicase